MKLKTPRELEIWETAQLEQAEADKERIVKLGETNRLLCRNLDEAERAYDKLAGISNAE